MKLIFVIKDDVRAHGSGNAGLTNFYRTYGAKYALGVIALDMGKTVVAGLIGGYLFWFLRQDWTLGLLVAGIGCELGHMFPAFYGFKGGKGILCGGTLAWMLGWKVGLVAWGLFAALWLLSKYVSLGSIFAGISLTVSVFLFYGHNWLYTALAFVISVLVVWSCAILSATGGWVSCWAASAASWDTCSRCSSASRAARASCPAVRWCGCWIGA